VTTANAFGTVRRGVFPSLQQQTLADARTQPFWDAAKQDRLVVPQCTFCRTFRLPPLPICYVCRSDGMMWTELPGTGTVYSHTTIHHPLHPDLVAVCPYVSAVVELDGTQGEGARMLVNVIDCQPEEVAIGRPVRIIFDHLNDEMSTPRARLVR
jgi:uncharacterized OB-fold protein